MNIEKALPKTLLEKIEGNVSGYSISKMSVSDQKFLYGLLHKVKPLKCVEIGVYSGGSSAIILDAIKSFANSRLYGVDISESHPFLKDKPIGFIVNDRFEDLRDKYTVYSGKDVSAIIEDIGDGIDFALIDTAHLHPCETLNLISILPFMKDNSWLVLHDIGMFYCQEGKTQSKDCFATKYIFDSWYGERICSEKCELFTIPNIGAIKIENVKENKSRLISLLFNRWDMEIGDDIINDVRTIIKKYYSEKDLEDFDRIISRKKYFKEKAAENIKSKTVVNKFVNKLKRALK